MQKKKSQIFLTILLALLSFSINAFGQTTGGAITGSVIDPQGAAIPNAKVSITNKATGFNVTAQTTSAGAYNFPNVPVGEYTLAVESSGFAQTSSDIKVALNQTTTADVTLQAAGVTGEVNVSANGDVLVQTDSSQLGKTFEARQVQDLPIFNNQNQLAVLAPNVVERSAGVLGSGGSVGGTRPRGNIFTVDGVGNNDPSTTVPLNSVIQDAISEFTLLTNNYNAEFGGGTGGQFNTITKSGTNRFSGSGFYYVQNEAFNAPSTQIQNAINAGQFDRQPKFRDHRGGFTLGGPVVKNKLFFFTAYERQDNNTAGSSYTFLAPTAEGLNRIAALPGVSQYVVGLLRNYSQLAPSQTFLKNVLAPSVNCNNTPNNVNCIPFGNSTITSPAGFKQNLFLLNFDYTPSGTDQFRFRYNDQRLEQEQTGGNFGVAIPAFNNFLNFSSKLASATWVRTFNSNLVNDLRISLRDQIDDYPLVNSQFNSFPNVFDVETGIDIGPNGNLPQGTPVNNNYQIFDALTLIRGQHSLKFGGEYNRLITRGLFLPRGRGDYVFTSFDELIQDAVPTFLALRGVGTPEFVGNQHYYSTFAQDDWKVRPNLTLNLGIRYEYVTLPRDARLQALNSIADVPGVIEFRVPKTDKNNLSPRVGFAYSPEWNTSVGRFLFGRQGQSSIRANFALTNYANFQNLQLLSLPPQAQTEYNVVSGGVNQNLPFLQSGGIPGVLSPATTTADARRITQARLTDQITPYSLSWTLSYQREITPSTAVEFRYLSTRGRKLPIQVRLNAGVVPSNLGLPTFLNQPTSGELAGLTTTLGQINAARTTALGQYGFQGFVTEFSPIGRSQYDAGSVSVTRRLSRGLAFTTAYTFSKTLDDSTNELNSSAINPRRPQDTFNQSDEWGLSALDIPHRFAASVTYDVPFFNSGGNALARTFLGGWQISAIFQAQSGQPFTPLSGVDSNRNGDAAGDRTIVNPNGVEGTGSAVRAINAQGQTVASGSASTVAYVAVNPNAQYIQAGLGARATAGRNTLRGRGFNRTDAVLLKNFRFTERYNLQIGAEAFDVFNQRPKIIGVLNPTAISLGITGLETNPSFANVNSPNFNDYSIGDHYGRSVTLRAKFFF
jgi:hypothetical protein